MNMLVNYLECWLVGWLVKYYAVPKIKTLHWALLVKPCLKRMSPERGKGGRKISHQKEKREGLIQALQEKAFHNLGAATQKTFSRISTRGACYDNGPVLKILGAKKAHMGCSQIV